MSRIRELIRRHERRRLTEDAAVGREELGAAFDALDEMGGFYVDSFLARLSVGFYEVCVLIVLLVVAVGLAQSSLNLGRSRSPLATVALCAGFAGYSLCICLRYVRRRNAGTEERRRSYVAELQEAGTEPDDAALARRFRRLPLWPVWATHLGLLAVILFGLVRYLGLL